MENAVGRSINLALSCRGIEALKGVGLSQAVRRTIWSCFLIELFLGLFLIDHLISFLDNTKIVWKR